MLINCITKKIKKNTDCLNCQFYNKDKKSCEGLGKRCFPYDPLTKTALDPITKFPIDISKIN